MVMKSSAPDAIPFRRAIWPASAVISAASAVPLGPDEPSIQDETIRAIGRGAVDEKRKGKAGDADVPPSGGRVMHIRGISRP